MIHESIRRWWHNLGKNAKKLMITADGGGSNGSRVGLFKIKLQKLLELSKNVRLKLFRNVRF